MTSPFIVLPPTRVIPEVWPAWLPSISTIGVPAYPGCVVPSMVTASTIMGKADRGRIVWTPASPILKTMRSMPGVLFACSIAHLNDPSPLSLVLLTTIMGLSCSIWIFCPLRLIIPRSSSAFNRANWLGDKSWPKTTAENNSPSSPAVSTALIWASTKCPNSSKITASKDCWLAVLTNWSDK